MSFAFLTSISVADRETYCDMSACLYFLLVSLSLYTPLGEAKGDVSLDGVAFSRLV